MSFFPSSGGPQGVANPMPFGMYQANDRATLYIFTPRQMTEQALRPLRYQLSGNLLDRANSALKTAVSGQGTGAIAALVNSPEAADAVFPVTQGHIPLALNKLGEIYTFMLIVNGEGTKAAMHMLNPLRRNRVIYYGYFIGEPFNPVFHGAEPTWNRNAQMMITHQTMVQEARAVGAEGATSRLKTMADLDIVTPMAMSPISTGDLCMLTPDYLYSNISTGADGYIYDTLGTTASLAEGASPVPVNTTMGVPQHHLEHLITSVQGIYDTVRAEKNFSQMSRGMTFGAGEKFVGDDIDSMLANSFRSATGLEHMTGLNVNQVITLGQIDSMYNPVTTIYPISKVSMYGTIDQGIESMSNVFSSLLTSVIPAMLNDVGLASLGFTYLSYAPPDARLQVTNVEALIAGLPQQQIVDMVKSMFVRLENGLFQILRTRDDFVLIGNFSSGWMSTCTLNFMSDQRVTDYFERPSFMGGFTSSLVGTVDLASNNGAELSQFVKALTGEVRDTAPFDASRYLPQLSNGLQTFDAQFGTGFQSPPVSGFGTGTPTFGQPGPTTLPSSDKQWV